MKLTIEAPEIERRIRVAARSRPVTPEQLILELVSTRLQLEQPTRTGGSDAPERSFYETTVDEWLESFDTRVSSHADGRRLPDDVFSRASFYAELAAGSQRS